MGVREFSSVSMRFNLCRAAVRVVAVAAAMSAVAQPARAQSFFQQLFGMGSPEPAATPQSAASQKAYSTRLTAGIRASQRSSAYREQSVRPDDGSYQPDPGYGGSYRTMCVRMCDGYYFPISGSASSDRFDRDARKCDASCVGEAKLFYMPKSSDTIRSMVSLDGQIYGKMKTAFLYRRTLVSGCGCKAAPWSVAETFRHGQYAAMIDNQRAKVQALRNRALAEAELPDQISMLIAVTEAGAVPRTEELRPVKLAALEPAALVAADEVVAFDATLEAQPDVLHVLPGVDGDAPMTVSVADDPRDHAGVAGMIEAVAEVAVWVMPDQHTGANGSQTGTRTLAEAGDSRRDRGAKKPGVRSARTKGVAPVQASWLQSSGSPFVYPGDAPSRAR